jgi:hypothetical protein
VVNGTTSPTTGNRVSVMVTDPFTREGSTSDTGTVLVTRTGSLANPLTVNLTVAGTAAEGVDYNTLPRR